MSAGQGALRDAGGTDIEPGAEAGAEAGLDADAYDVLRGRLEAAARELARRAETLNARRQEVFGGSELRLAGSERLRTARASLPADVAPVGRYLLFAANPAEVTEVADVFQLLSLPGGDGTDGEGPGGDGTGGDGTGGEGPGAGLEEAPAVGLLDDPAFQREFAELYRYYRETRLLRLRVLEGRLLAVFRTGPGAGDVRALGWRVGRDGRCRYEGAAREAGEEAAGAHAVAWTAAGRADHVPGRHPHLALTAADGGTLTVATTGGELALRTGESEYREPVEDALQSLADAEVAWATAGPLLLLRVRPYREDADRHFAVNTRTGEIERIDALGQACLRLPDEQGVIFPGGYALATGGTRTFDVEDPQPGGEPLEFERLVRSANGEDVLYVFHAAADGRRLLLPYNLIRQEAAAPLHVQGCALYEDGTLLTLRPAEGGEPVRVHPVRRWRTPFLSDTYAAARPVGAGPLARIGNPDLVRAVSDALSVARSALETTPATAVYEALTAACDRVLDRHHWLAEPESGGLAGPLAEVRDTGRQVLAEYARVREQRSAAAQAVEEAAAQGAALVRRVRGEAASDAGEWVRRLTELRCAQGRLVTLRDLRYADHDRLDALAAELTRELAAAAGRAADCFADEHAFDAQRERIEEIAVAAAAIGTAADAEPMAAELDEQAAGLRTVTETAGTLEIADATVRTRILAAAADVLGAVNRARALLDARRGALLARETQAEFAAESALLGQSVSGALAAAGTPEECDEQLGRLLVQVEDLATRFAAGADRLAELAERREEIQQTFAARKQALSDERADRVRRLALSAERILDGVRRRAAGLDSLDDVNTYFAADPMPAQHRRIAGELADLGDPARAAELTAALAAARQDTGRALRDRQDLYEDGGAVIRLGRHRFAVNTRPFDLALVPHDGGLAFTISGTDYLMPVRDEELASTRRFWNRPLVSESPDLYRAEYLAASLLLTTPSSRLATTPPADLVREATATRLDEGYERGVHDHDATLLLEALHPLLTGAALLRYPPQVRAAAQLVWTFAATPEMREGWETRARSLTRATSAFGATARRTPPDPEPAGSATPRRVGTGAPVPARPGGAGAPGADGPGGLASQPSGGPASGEPGGPGSAWAGGAAAPGAGGPGGLASQAGVADRSGPGRLASRAGAGPALGEPGGSGSAWAGGAGAPGAGGPGGLASQASAARGLSEPGGSTSARTGGAGAAERGEPGGSGLAWSGGAGATGRGLPGGPASYGGGGLVPGGAAAPGAGGPGGSVPARSGGAAAPGAGGPIGLASQAGAGPALGEPGGSESRPVGGDALAGLAHEIGLVAGEFLRRGGVGGLGGGPGGGFGLLVGEYLVGELASAQGAFVEGVAARGAREGFVRALGGVDGVPYKEFTADLAALGGDLSARWQLASAWLGAFTASQGAAAGIDGDVIEVAAALVCGERLNRYGSDADVRLSVTGLLGAHPRISDGRIDLRADELLCRVREFGATEVPAYRAYQRARGEAVDRERARLGLESYRARAIGGFVRNRLLDEVSLPLVGDSLDKQFGAAGGLLMLMSPPGYGKTSLMEYVAARLGLALVTVSGPALGSATTSLDPERAPDAAARREVEKITFALELGSNVLLYLDDIQHTSPELLQKFIPLCDAQRRVEGTARSYDLRGKRFAVCMAGNPYTESGRLFRIPDMLANRADVWNLGDVLTGREALFALSYVENSLTANDVLAPLAGRDRADVELLIRLAEDDPTARADALAYPYSAAERGEILAVLRHLLRARATVLDVNAAYIASAATADHTRTEPPFLLQGSYRTMNRIAARIVPTMNAAELDALVTDHYRAEAQTLASGAEAALLKLAEIRGLSTPEQSARWAALRADYPRPSGQLG
ncbi:DNA repair ATPase [Streptomyces sp. CA-111067]|uniref:DNA repair ATPase n=1 Tax=Streptomyces sp. CA-111067 TaxID=3240046 RepID=UPI003D97D579